MSVRAALSTLCTLIAGTALAADQPGPNDWPQWRGPNRDGKSAETGLLKSWPQGGPSKLWATTKDLGTGFGTPSVAAGKIFGMGARNGKDGVWALSEADGKELWFTPIDDNKNLNQNNGPCSTPTYANGKVYAVSSINGVIVKLDAETGKVEWSKSYVKDFGSSTPIWGFNDSPLVDGDHVICATSGSKGALTALKVSNGDVAWSTNLGKIDNQRGGGGYCSPVKATIGGVPQYIVITDREHGIIGVNAKTGEKLWDFNKVSFGGTAQIPTPIVEGDKVWFSTAYDDKAAGSTLLQIASSGGKFTAKEIQSYKKSELTNHHGNMILLDGYVYFGHGQNNGIPVCVEMKTGKLMWKADKYPPGANASAAYSAADGMLYVRYQNRMMTLVKPSPKEDENKVVSSFMLPEPNESKRYNQSWPHPVIANGKLYIRDQNVLYCYNVKATTN